MYVDTLGIKYFMVGVFLLSPVSDFVLPIYKP